MLKPETPSPGLKYWYPMEDAPDPRAIDADVVVYGGSAAGAAAAVQATRMGKKATLLVFGRHVGGMTSGGLGQTDIGNKDAIGGISREFYRRAGEHYQVPEAWQFEPHVAERVLGEMLEDAGVEVRFEQRLSAIHADDKTIIDLRTPQGDTIRGRMFIDATYEGDLMAMAGVSHTVGRESNRQYHETLNGIHFGHPGHNFKAWVDPYIKQGDPASGLLPGVQDMPLGFNGQGDRCIQAYNFRVCLTHYKSNQRAFPKPFGYDPKRYELLLRYIEAGVWDALHLTSRVPNHKTDTNNYGGFSSDHIGANYGWAQGTYDQRERIFQDHVNYNQGMYYFLTQDARIPARVREQVLEWGLPRDEFRETGGWPHELYIREARRMVSDVVMTEHHCRGRAHAADSVGLAAYTMDSHNCRRLVVDGRAYNEGNVEVPPSSPYEISYRSIIPRSGECENLLVPWCLSASHIAFGSIRMEPVGMVLGQSAATAACMAIDQNIATHAVDYRALRARLERDGQVLNWRTKTPVTWVRRPASRAPHTQAQPALTTI